MKTYLFGREMEVEFLAESYDTSILFSNDYDMTFTVSKPLLGSTPNSGTIKIFNCNLSNRTALEAKNATVILRVGYKNNDGLSELITAEVDWVDNYKRGPSWVSEIHFAESGTDIRSATISKSYKGSVNPTKVLEDALAKLKNTGKGIWKDIKEEIIPDEDLSITGKVSAVIDKFLLGSKLQWTVQQNELHILTEEALLDSDITVLTPESGLIGAPTRFKREIKTKKNKKKGIKASTRVVYGINFKCLIIPEIFPAKGVRIESQSITGLYKVYDCTYSGSNHGGDWSCSGEGFKINE